MNRVVYGMVFIGLCVLGTGCPKIEDIKTSTLSTKSEADQNRYILLGEKDVDVSRTL